MLVFKRLVRWNGDSIQAERIQTQRNALTSPYLWMLSALASAPAVLFWKNQPALIGLTVLFGVLYVLLYWRVVRFKAPRWMVLKKHKYKDKYKASESAH
jgi:hypothetical protein